jgi:hypothetical protein
MRTGDVPDVMHKTVERGKNPVYFWVMWSMWTAIAALAWWRTGRLAWQAWTDPSPLPVAFSTWAPWAAVVGLFVGFGLWAATPIRWHRRGNRWTHRAEYRREKALRALLKQLTDDRLTGDEDETLDFLVDWSHIDWLEQLAINLAGQEPPRRLRLAIDATPEPPFEDDEEDDA